MHIYKWRDCPSAIGFKGRGVHAPYQPRIWQLKPSGCFSIILVCVKGESRRVRFEVWRMNALILIKDKCPKNQQLNVLHGFVPTNASGFTKWERRK